MSVEPELAPEKKSVRDRRREENDEEEKKANVFLNDFYVNFVCIKCCYARKRKSL